MRSQAVVIRIIGRRGRRSNGAIADAITKPVDHSNQL
jgi:hypothetical protein